MDKESWPGPITQGLRGGRKEHEATPHLLDPQVLVGSLGGLEQGGPFRGTIRVGGCHLGVERHCEPGPGTPPLPVPLPELALTEGPWPSTAMWSCSLCSWARRACSLPRTSRSSCARRSVSSWMRSRSRGGGAGSPPSGGGRASPARRTSSCRKAGCRGMGVRGDRPRRSPHQLTASISQGLVNV